MLSPDLSCSVLPSSAVSRGAESCFAMPALQNSNATLTRVKYPDTLPTDLANQSVVHAGRWVGIGVGRPKAQGRRHPGTRQTAGWEGRGGEERVEGHRHTAPSAFPFSLLHDVDRRSTQSLIAP